MTQDQNVTQFRVSKEFVRLRQGFGGLHSKCNLPLSGEIFKAISPSWVELKHMRVRSPSPPIRNPMVTTVSIRDRLLFV